MSRLIDRLYAHGFRLVTDQHPEGQLRTVQDFRHPETGRAYFEDATAFVIDNVAEYLYAENDQECWTFEADFPCVMLPFPTVWMETRRPSRLLSTDYPTRVPTEWPLAWGVLLSAQPFQHIVMPDRAEVLHMMERGLEQIRTDVERAIARLQAANFQLTLEQLTLDEQVAMRAYAEYDHLRKLSDDDWRQAATSANILKALDGRQPRWMVSGMVFLEFHKTVINGPVVMFNFLVDGLGKVVPIPAFEGDGAVKHIQYASPVSFDLERQRMLQDEMQAALFPVWLALSFCHCKNVQIVPQVHLQRGKPQRYHGHARMTYHTLNIQPMRTVLQHEGKNDGTGLKLALSICRGHFKSYAQGKGLFGKLHGLYWWEQHLRGSSQYGVVVNDYAVHP